MSWLYLALAILFEMSGTLLMKLSGGFSHIGYSIIMFVCYMISLTMLSFALKHIEIGTAYAIWSGIGIALIVASGVLFFKEQLTVQKIIFIGFIVIGAIGLNLHGTVH